MFSILISLVGMASGHLTLRLDVPITKRIVRDSAFSVIGAKLWNGVPLDIRQATDVKHFKKQLKSHLFPKD